jgi:putative CocE/NonD family hydrolase
MRTKLMLREFADSRRGTIRSLAWIVVGWSGIIAATTDAADKPAYTVETNVPVPMRDGTILRADVYRPLGAGPFAVLVQRTPYGKGAQHAKLTEAGFIVVSQDLRGRHASDGVFESFNRPTTHDGSDGYDTIEWAAKLPGSTGRVGTLGVSYDAFVQWRAVGTKPPSLGAFAAFSIPAKYTDLEMPGTVRPGRRWEWWATQSADMRKKAGGPGPHSTVEAKKIWDAGQKQTVLHTLPWLSLPDSLFAHEAHYMKDWLRRPWVDVWRLDEEAARATVPNLNVCGWYDHCNGSIDLHTAIATRGATDAARQHSKLIVGPWGHVGLGRRKSGVVDFGENAEMNLRAVQARWFAHWLGSPIQTGGEETVEQWPAVRLFVMGANQWRSFEQWPPPGTEPRSFYLAGDGRANTPSGDGQLVDAAPPETANDTYVYDPRDPVPTLWGGSTFTVATEQSPLAERRDILVYQTAPLDVPLETIGYGEVVLYAVSDRLDTDFFVRLIDVHPNGKAYDLCEGMVRARHRESLEKVTLLTPGETVEYRIRLRPTAHRFLPGHRMRLDVTSSDFPSYDRNHNTAADPNADAELATATQTVRHGGKYGSRLTLPTLRVP